MRTNFARRLGAAVITVAGAVAIAPTGAAAEAAWTATAFETPAGVFAVRINGTDGVTQTVGSFDTIEGGQHRPGVIWHGTRPTVLGEAFDELTDLTAVNTSGVAVGSHGTPVTEPSQAVRWTGTRYEDLPAPAGSASVATAINERGDVVGTADGQVIFWPASAPDTYRLLPMPFPTSAGNVSIDDAGTIVAVVLDSNGAARSFRWDHQIWPRELDRVQQNSGHSVLTVENGRIAGAVSVSGAVLWDALGHVQRFIPDVAIYGMNTSGDLLARSSSGGPWFVEEDGVRTSLPSDFTPSFSQASLFTDGSVAGYTINDTTGAQTATLFRR